MANPGKKTASVMIMVMSTEDKNQVIRTDMWFKEKHHQADGFTKISPDMQCAVYCHWGHITL